MDDGRRLSTTSDASLERVSPPAPAGPCHAASGFPVQSVVDGVRGVPFGALATSFSQSPSSSPVPASASDARGLVSGSTSVSTSGPVSSGVPAGATSTRSVTSAHPAAAAGRCFTPDAPAVSSPPSPPPGMSDDRGVPFGSPATSLSSSAAPASPSASGMLTGGAPPPVAGASASSPPH